MVLVGFQYEPVSLDVNEVCFEEEHNFLNTREKSRKSQGITEWCTSGKCVATKLKLWDTFNYWI